MAAAHSIDALAHEPPPRHAAISLVNYVALLLAIAVVLIWARLIVVALLVGLGIGVILAPALQAMHRRLHLRRSIAAALVVIFGLTLLGLIAWGVFAAVDSQIALLSERMPEMLRRLEEQLQGVLSRYPWLKQSMAEADLATSASRFGAVLFKGAWSGFGVLSSLVFAAVIGVYVAVDALDYHRSAVRSFPAALRPSADRLLSRSAETIRTWFRAQLLDMLIIGGLTSLGLWAVGAEYWLLLGVLTALFGIIPYLGIAIVVIFSGLLTLASDPGRLPWVLGVFLLTQQLEGNLVLPLIMRGSARLSAVPLLTFMLLMGAWAGLLGVLIAPPLFAVLCLLYRELHLPRADAAVRPEDGGRGQRAGLADPRRDGVALPGG